MCFQLSLKPFNSDCLALLPKMSTARITLDYTETLLKLFLQA